MFHYTVELNKSVEDTIKLTEEKLKEIGFGVLWSFNVKNKLNEKGLDFKNEVIVLEVCNPKEAKKVLDVNLLASYFLPCKITVVSDNGVTKIGMVKPTELIKMFNDEKLEEIATEIENKLIRVLESLK